MMTSLIVAVAENGVIGRTGSLPWHLPADLRRFKALTYGHPVVLGRVTHQSVLERLGRPLPGRTSVVVSSGPGSDSAEVRWAPSVEAALATARTVESGAAHGEIFIAGGESIYRQALHSADRVLLTQVHSHVEGDRVMPAGWLDGFTRARAERHLDGISGLAYSFVEYRR